MSEQTHFLFVISREGYILQEATFQDPALDLKDIRAIVSKAETILGHKFYLPTIGPSTVDSKTGEVITHSKINPYNISYHNPDGRFILKMLLESNVIACTPGWGSGGAKVWLGLRVDTL